MHQPRIMYSRSFLKVARLLGISVLIALPIGVLINSLRQMQISDPKPIRPVVSAAFSAGSANDLRGSERAILKDALKGLPAISYVGFGVTSAHEAVLMIVFDQGTDRKAAVADMQERLNAVQAKLPNLTKRGGATLTETVLSRLIFLNVRGPANPQKQQIVDNESLVHLLAELNQIPGVAGTMIVCGHSYVIRLKLNRDRMRRWDVSADQVVRSFEDASDVFEPQQFEEIGCTSEWIEYARVRRFLRHHVTPELYARVILKATAKGEIVRLEDVGTIEICPLYYEASHQPEGLFTATIVLTRLPNASSDVVMKAVGQKVKRFRTTFMSFEVNDKLPINHQP